VLVQTQVLPYGPFLSLGGRRLEEKAFLPPAALPLY